jgi:pimeloyl-ACP methyl ester carboxylesterase
MMGCVSPELMARKFREKASESERKCLDERYNNEETRNDDFARELDWMLLGRDGGSTLDVAVCLSTSQDLGIDYTKGTAGALFLNGDNDGIAPLAVTEWLAQQIPKSSVTVIPKGTHNGALFMLDERIIESLNVLR